MGNFNILPDRAHYFDNLADLYYDNSASRPSIDWTHIILDNVERLPLSFLLDHKPKGFEFRDYTQFGSADRELYFKELRTHIESDEKTLRSIKNRLDDALKLTLKRVDWNYKTAIPMYYPTKNNISLLLPLSLVDDDIIDLALITERQKSGSYIGHTIIPLDWAYSNARLITRPDSDWLIAEKIELLDNAND